MFVIKPGTGGTLLLAAALLGLLHPLPPFALAQKSSTPRADVLPRNSSGICKSVDIRNTMKNFENLKGCKVVEGFVQILLFDNVNGSAFDHISFPDLVEITDFLLLYRVNGLRSVGQLFPNLTVIRGQDTVFGYSFVIYEMSSLQEIGLHSLTDITAGLIRIDKNPSLCHVNSINWDLIAHEKGDHYRSNAKADNECPRCPGDADDVSDLKCQMFQGNHMCWNRQHCQKICPKNCANSCTATGKCCDAKCLGGCNEHNLTDCTVCKTLTVDPNAGGQCINSCDEERYEFLGRRCVTRDECINFHRPLKLQKKIPYNFPYKLHHNNVTKRNSCLLECPADYMPNHSTSTCERCKSGCQKECPGTVVDSLAAAKQLRGCTHINGSLEIQLRGGNNAVNELEDHLSEIKVIDGYLKIVRSFPLFSLSFLKKLNTIRGNSLDGLKYSFVVLDNQNLLDIWNWENRTLKILNGRLFFHFNPKLCINNIKVLAEKTKLYPYTETEVALSSNGDKIACIIQNLDVRVVTREKEGMILAWNKFNLPDHRKLLGYVIYSKAAPTRNITFFDGRDACGGDGWRVDDVPPTDNPEITYPLTQLKPFTQYAIYVKTYTIASEKTGAQSDISYVRTLPAKPTIPVFSKSYDQTSDSLTIEWKPPLHPNGELAYYIVSGEMLLDKAVADLNYCNEFPSSEKSTSETTGKPDNDNKRPSLNDTSECVCKLDNKPKSEKEVDNEIDFEDKLYNFVYIKKNDAKRRKRDLDSIPFPSDTETEPTNPSFLANMTNTYGKYISFNYKVFGTILTMRNLMHYTKYNVYISACRELDDDEMLLPHNNCSETAIVPISNTRTRLKYDADKITDIKVVNKTKGIATISWKEPESPNGYIGAYRIEFMNAADGTGLERICVNISEFAKNHKKYVLPYMKPGNYSVKIMRTATYPVEYSAPIYVVMEEDGSNLTPTVVTVIAFILVIVSVVYWFILRKNNNAKENINKLLITVNHDYVPSLSTYVPDEWEVERDNITKLKELGQGSFGMVFEGVARDLRMVRENIERTSTGEIKCAIKTINEHATGRERIEFLNEASVMKAFDTAHVVKLLGVVSKDSPLKEILVVMELMGNGDLKTYLRSHRPDGEMIRPPPTLRRILQMAIEIADGMAYLAAKKFVHRDLAARNCMVAEDLTVKIGDFGMARDIYETDYYRKGSKGLLPVRWMAPESLKDGVFTTSSDVWSYGIVLWEMSTLAYQPYQGLTNDQVLRYVIDGGTMERPENCPDKLYDLMRICWRHKSSDRPTFLQLCTILIENASPNFTKISFYHTTTEATEGKRILIKNRHHDASPSQDDPSTPLRRTITKFCLSDDDSDSEFSTFPALTKSDLNGYVLSKPSNGSTT